MLLQPAGLRRACQPSEISRRRATQALAAALSAAVDTVEPLKAELRPAQSMAHTALQPATQPQQHERPLLSVAPMMDWTDVHYRQLARLLSRRTWLWTEMVVDKTIIHTPQLDRFLWFPAEQRPLVCQLGGSDPATLAAAAAKVAEYGYDEINLNCGCPSDRVAGAGCFGAALMLQPEVVAQCMAAIAAAAPGLAVSVKCRLGVDQEDSYDALLRFIRIVSEGSPVTHFIIHARKCFLKGLNPHQNRTVPPLRYEWLYGLKRDFPHLRFSLNGGIQGVYEARGYLDHTPPLAAWAESGTGSMQPTANGPAPDSMQGTGPTLAQRQEQKQWHQAPDAPSHVQVTSSHDNRDSGTTGQGSGNGSGSSWVDVAAPEELLQPGASHAQQPPPLQGLPRVQAPVLEPEAEAGAHQLQQQPVHVLDLEGVMIGRQAYNDPWGVLADADRAIFGEAANPAASRRQVLDAYGQYCDAVQGRWGTKPDGHQEPNVRAMMKPLLNLFHAEKGSKKWKAEVDALLQGKPVSVRQVLDATLQHLPDEVLDAPPRRGPCADLARHGLLSAAPAEQVTLGRLPAPRDRAGYTQEPGLQDTKRPPISPSSGAAQVISSSLPSAFPEMGPAVQAPAAGSDGDGRAVAVAEDLSVVWSNIASQVQTESGRVTVGTEAGCEVSTNMHTSVMA